MNTGKNGDLGTSELFDVLQVFVAEAIKYLRKHTDISQIPTIRKYVLEQEGSKSKILPSDQPNWWQVSSYMNPILKLESYNAALLACKKNRLLKKRNGMSANALGHGTSFQVESVPQEFLTECIVRENGFSFHKSTVSDVFKNLVAFVSSATQNKACLVAPIDAVVMERRCINLDSEARIRRLSPTDVTNLVNRCSILGHFYGQALSPWFSAILEIDFTFNWDWQHVDNPNQGMSLEHIQNAQSADATLRHRLNEEIIVLRTLLNTRICAPTFVIDYGGWNSAISSGGVIHYLPWQRSAFGIPTEIGKKESSFYSKHRSQFLNLKDETVKRRIFAAMQRLSAALDGAYASDRLFDAVAGLEGLLVNSQTEVGHKLAERTSLLIRGEPGERVDLFNEMKKAYKLRSKVAHGNAVADDLYLLLINGKSSKKQYDEYNSVNKLSNSCMKHLHASITKCIAKGVVDFDWTRSILSGPRIV